MILTVLGALALVGNHIPGNPEIALSYDPPQTPLVYQGDGYEALAGYADRG
jgi:hypothetical protein